MESEVIRLPTAGRIQLSRKRTGTRWDMYEGSCPLLWQRTHFRKGEKFMTIDEMNRKKIELGYTNQMISEKSGIPVSTLQKIFSGRTKAPRAATIRALNSVFISPDAAPASGEFTGSGDYSASQNTGGSSAAAPAADVVREEAPARPADKRYTIDDYIALPEEQRVELIDGVFYDLTAPTTFHQAAAGWIHARFLQFVEKNKGTCYPFISPVDVQLDCDDYTVVQPDVMILCDREKLKYHRIYGAPDFILEVLSPSTRKKDLTLKLLKYTDAGVREYWLLDPQKKQLIQYDLEHMEIPRIFGGNDEVPVLIWDGRCTISLKELFSRISFLLD